VRVDIVDTGRGIALEHRGRIFDWFFTTKEIGAGAGLGLSVARRIIVDSHGGSIAAESRPGEGTTVTVWIPTADTAP
jgi:two-component system, NtrC family, sensor kinase